MHKHTLGKELCRVFGFDPQTITSLTLKFEVGNIAKLEVTRIMSDDEGRRCHKIFEKYPIKLGPPL